MDRISFVCRGDLEGINSKVEEDQSTATSRTEELKTWEYAPKATCSCHSSMPARQSVCLTAGLAIVCYADPLEDTFCSRACTAQLLTPPKSSKTHAGCSLPFHSSRKTDLCGRAEAGSAL